MREILFRSKSPDDGGWIYGDYFKNTYGETFIRFWGNRTFKDFKAFPETVSQYTGLDDSNGKKIFEGDILHCRNGNGNIEFTAAVEFGNTNCWSSWGWHLKYLGGNEAYILGDILLWAGHEAPPGALCEIIGNIHDNPDLLEA